MVGAVIEQLCVRASVRARTTQQYYQYKHYDLPQKWYRLSLADGTSVRK